MQLSFNTLKKHPIALAFYVAYLFLIMRYLFIRAEMAKQMELHPERSGIQNGGEAAQWVLLATLFWGGVFAFVTAGYAIGAKNNRFYLFLLALIIVPLIILGNV